MNWTYLLESSNVTVGNATISIMPYIYISTYALQAVVPLAIAWYGLWRYKNKNKEGRENE